MTKESEMEHRGQCLALAHQEAMHETPSGAGTLDTDAIIAKAEKYLAFVKGQTNE